MRDKLRELVQAIVNRWDDDKNDYRGRAILLSLKAALAASEPASAFDGLKDTPSAYEPISQKRLQRLEDEAAPSGQPVTSAVYLLAKIEELRNGLESAYKCNYKDGHKYAAGAQEFICHELTAILEGR